MRDRNGLSLLFGLVPLLGPLMMHKVVVVTLVVVVVGRTCVSLQLEREMVKIRIRGRATKRVLSFMMGILSHRHLGLSTEAEVLDTVI